MDGQLVVKGMVELTFRNAAGEVTSTHVVKNRIVSNGLSHIGALMAGHTPAPMKYMAIGFGSAATGPNDKQLGQEGARVELTKSVTASFDANAAIVTYLATFPAGMSTGQVCELGIFNALSAGIMLARTTFTAQPKDADATLDVRWNINLLP